MAPVNHLTINKDFENNLTSVSTNLLKSSVSIFTYSFTPEQSFGWSGSACFIDVSPFNNDTNNYYLLSAWHVIDESETVQYYSFMMNNGFTLDILSIDIFEKYLVSRDIKHDLILLKIPRDLFGDNHSPYLLKVNPDNIIEYGSTVINCG